MQVLVIGAGVIGLPWHGRRLARHDVTVAELTGGIANGVSSRNSEVIHGAFTIRPDRCGRHCVQGRRLLYDFCASHGVAHRRWQAGRCHRRRRTRKVEGILRQGAINASKAWR